MAHIVAIDASVALKAIVVSDNGKTVDSCTLRHGGEQFHTRSLVVQQRSLAPLFATPQQRGAQFLVGERT